MNLKTKAVVVSVSLVVGALLSTCGANAAHTPLHDIIKTGNVALAKALCEEDKDWFVDWINEEDEFGLTPLHYAVKMRNLEAVRFLVEHHANVNARCAKKVYDAPTAVKRWERSRLLNPSWDGKQCGCTPLHYATKNGDLVISKYLVEHGARVNMKNSFGDSAASYAFTVDTTDFFADDDSFGKKINIDLVEYLIENNADINTRDIDGLTPLGLLRNDYFFLKSVVRVGEFHKLRKIEAFMDYLVSKGAQF